jgi:hypothetical protein
MLHYTKYADLGVVEGEGAQSEITTTFNRLLTVVTKVTKHVHLWGSGLSRETLVAAPLQRCKQVYSYASLEQKDEDCTHFC